MNSPIPVKSTIKVTFHAPSQHVTDGRTLVSGNQTQSIYIPFRCIEINRDQRGERAWHAFVRIITFRFQTRKDATLHSLLLLTTMTLLSDRFRCYIYSCVVAMHLGQRRRNGGRQPEIRTDFVSLNTKMWRNSWWQKESYIATTEWTIADYQNMFFGINQKEIGTWEDQKMISA
jgi:hypothetical protein